METKKKQTAGYRHLFGLLFFLLMMNFPAEALSKDHFTRTGQFKVSITQTIENDPFEEVNFTYTIYPVQRTAILPVNDLSLILTGAGTISWVFDLDHLEIGDRFDYRIEQTEVSSSMYTRDCRNYTLSIYGAEEDGELCPEISISESDKNYSSVLFHSVYQKIMTAEEKSENLELHEVETSREASEDVLTGLFPAIFSWLFFALLLIGSVTLLIHRRKDYRTY